jgi:hypothetical protein
MYYPPKIFWLSLSPNFLFSIFPSLYNALSFKHVTCKLLILKSSNDGPQVISFKAIIISHLTLNHKV